jgi:hypothetical protein
LTLGTTTLHATTDSTKIAIVDTFYRPILVPSTVFSKFITYIQGINSTLTTKKITCDTTTSGGYCYYESACSVNSAKFGDLVVQLSDSHGITVSASSYLIDKPDAAGNSGCLIGI